MKNEIMNRYLFAGSIFGMLAVAIGAFGAHGLEDLLLEHALQRYHTGVEYQFYHVAPLLIIGGLSSQHNHTSKLLTFSGVAFIIGIILFSGSLYLYALTSISTFGIITPVGGISLIVGWVCLMFYAVKQKK